MAAPPPPPKEQAFSKRQPASALTVGVPKEIHALEKRVAIAPANVPQLRKKGFKVAVEKGAGAEADFPDSAYQAAGAEIVSKEDAFGADIVMKVRAPEEDGEAHELDLMKEGATLICMVAPGQNVGLLYKFQQVS